jgi:hypothetical protein
MKKTVFLAVLAVSSLNLAVFADTPEQIAARKAREAAEEQENQPTPAAPAQTAAVTPASAPAATPEPAPAQPAAPQAAAPAPAAPAPAEQEPAKAEAPALEPVKILQIALGTGVESRELQGEAKEFDESVGRVTCWMKVSVPTAPRTLKHVWYRDDKKITEIPLTISYPTTRTWSNNRASIGNWQVAVLDEAGNELARESFTVKETPPAPAPAAQTPASSSGGAQ